MKQYQKVIKQILESGVEKESGRENMPNVIGISNATIKMDLKDGFPLLTTKKMYWKGVVHELLWFLRGETNIKYLVDNNVNIWNQDAYRWYLVKCEENNQTDKLTFESFIETIKTTKNTKKIFGKYRLGDLDNVYGYNWRNIKDKNSTTNLDQVARVIDGLKTNPYSRYHIINSWDVRNFDNCALMPCHLLYQFICRKPKKLVTPKLYQKILKLFGLYKDKFVIDNEAPFILDLNMYQRSCDTFLGLPFNLTSTALLLKLFAKVSNMEEGVATWIGGDTHLYKEHVSVAEEQLKREPFKLPELKITKEINNLEDILNLTIDNFVLENYESHPTLKAELFTGLK